MKKLFLMILATVTLTGCAELSSRFTTDNDKQLNLQNYKAADSIINDKNSTNKSKRTATDIKNNSEQLGISSVGLPKDTSVLYTPDNSKKYRDNSKSDAEKNWIDIAIGILNLSNIPWFMLLATLLGYWRQYKKAYREKGIKFALFDGVEKVLEVSNPKTAKIIKTIMKTEAASHNIHKEIKSDLKARK